MIEVEVISTGKRLVPKKGDRIRVTYQAADIADAGSGSSSFSTSFTIPLTAENIEALGFATVPNVQSQLSPYKNIKARLLDDNNEVDRGFIRIDEDDPIEREVTCTFLGRNVDWFSSIGDSNLRDLDLSRYDHRSTPANIDLTRTEGYVYLPVDYGSLEAKSSAQIDFGEIFPAIFIKDIVKQIFKDAGYKVRGSLLDRPDYNRMLIPFNGNLPTHSDEWVNARIARASGVGTQTIGTGVEAKLQLSDILSTSYARSGSIKVNMGNSLVGNYDSSSYRYTADEPMDVIVAIHIFMQVQNNFTVRVKRNGAIVNSSSFGQAQEYLTAPISLQEGDYLEVFVFTSGAPVTAVYDGYWSEANRVRSYVEFYPQKTFSTGSTYQMAWLLPDMKQKELIEYLFFIFAVIPSFDKLSNSVVLDTVNVLNALEAEDWTGKVDTKEEYTRDFFDFVSDYAKENICWYKDGDNDSLLLAYKATYGVGYGQGAIEIDNDYLEGSSDYYEAPFCPTISRKVFTGISNLNLLLPYMQQDDSETPRILYYAPNISVEELTGGTISTITIGGVARTNIPFAYFINKMPSLSDPIATQHLGFGDPLDYYAGGKSLLKNNYDKLTRVLNRPLAVSPSLRINALEVANIRYDRLKYFEELGGYYYLNQVGQYDGSGEPTECELIKWI